jgi:iron complex transport system ATP-binding protein
MLELRSVTCRLGGKDRLVGADLHVQRGQIVGVIGPNGAVKTTLLRVAAGLLAPSAGEVFIHGDSMRSLSVGEQARRRAFVAGRAPWLEGTPLLDAVLLGCSPRLGTLGLPSPDDVERAHDLLVALGFDAHATRDVATLSQGERQRAAVAMGCLQQAPLLLLDEPTSAQDFDGIARIAALLRAHADSGGAVLLALHDLNVAAALCDGLCLLRAGRIDFRGSAADLLRSGALERVYGPHVRVTSDPVAVLPVPFRGA